MYLSNTSAPVPQYITAKYTDVRFNGTLDWPSPYRGQPSPAIDDAWNHLGKGEQTASAPNDDVLISNFCSEGNECVA